MYVINPPYTFYIDYVSTKKVLKLQQITTGTLKTHRSLVDVYLVSGSNNPLSPKGKFGVYMVSKQTLKHRFQEKFYLHGVQWFDNLKDAVLFYYEKTGSGLTDEVSNSVCELLGEELNTLSETEQRAFKA